MVWDGVRLAHNPEVAGSNPAPATNASAVLPQVTGPQASACGPVMCTWGVCTLTKSLTTDVSCVPQRLSWVRCIGTLERDQDPAGYHETAFPG